MKSTVAELAYAKARYERLKATGVCVWCNKNRARTGLTRCEPCKSKDGPVSAKAFYKRRLAERRAMLDAFKLERGCELCGYAKYPEALEFDHRDPALKISSVSNMTMGNIETLMAEIEKCRILCANCHRVESVRNGHLRARGVAIFKNKRS